MSAESSTAGSFPLRTNPSATSPGRTNKNTGRILINPVKSGQDSGMELLVILDFLRLKPDDHTIALNRLLRLAEKADNSQGCG